MLVLLFSFKFPFCVDLKAGFFGEAKMLASLSADRKMNFIVHRVENAVNFSTSEVFRDMCMKYWVSLRIKLKFRAVPIIVFAQN